MTLTLLSYNNYYNRIVKRFDTFPEYVADGAFLLDAVNDINFNPNDGITTSAIVNTASQTPPDYVLLMEDTNTIISRWYVIECVRTRKNQYNLSLLRDVIADFYDKVVAAPVFVEKATLAENSPFLFNNENMTYNQIKTSETLLMDETETPWIVGYVANSLEEKVISVPTEQFTVDYPNLTDLNEYDYAQYTKENPYKSSYNKFRTVFYAQDTYSTFGYQINFNENNQPVAPLDTTSQGNAGGIVYTDGGKSTKTGLWRRAFVNWPTLGSKLAAAVSASSYDFRQLSYAYTGISSLGLTEIVNEEGKIIQAADKYYRIHVHNFITPAQRVEIQSIDPNAQKWYELAQEADVFDLSNTSNISPFCGFTYTTNAYYITFEEMKVAAFSFTIGGDRRKLTDAPYSMFAMPAKDLGFTRSGSIYTSNGFNVYRVAQNLIVNLGENLYDIQLLPYCPLPNISLLGGNLAIDGEEGTDFVLIKDEDDVVGGFLLWLSESSFSRRLNYNIPQPATALEIKVANECDKYRIVSPTYNGEFEFSAAKNGGVSGFNVFCTYKPFNPLIKVAPVFSGLYGQEFQDGRGCICQGDFSLPQINDAWVNYQINNKNYLNSFNRQIENMEVNNAVQRELEAWNVAGGALSAGATAGLATGMVGGGIVGGIAAGVVGAGASLLGGSRDIALNERLRKEALDYTKDQFGYQLGNVQALPYSLANIGAQTILSKLYPFLEYYTATEPEKEALRNKVRYNGMTVMAIGTMANYIVPNEKTYIKGKLIRLENAEEEFHFVNTIANEINQGVFI